MAFKDGFSGGGVSLPGGIRWFDLLVRETVIAISVGNTVWDQKVLQCAELELLGPALQEIIVHVELRNVSTANFGCRVLIQWKYEDSEWTQPVDGDVVVAEVNAASYPAPVVFTDRTRLGRRRIRLLLQYHAKTGGVAGDKGDVSVGVACRPFCC